jgi:uncharacterized protein (TIGR02217 family)
MGFHEVRFPVAVSRGATGGPERRTQVVATGGGYEERNQQWRDSRHRYDAGTGIKTLDQLHQVVAFFEERRGRAYGFRWKDWADYRSCPPLVPPAPDDQLIGTGDGLTTAFQLSKEYGLLVNPWRRTIVKPVPGTVRIAVGGVELAEGTDFTLDETTGGVLLAAAPAVAEPVTAGFEFDVPVRFDTDRLSIDLAAFDHGEIPSIPVVEIRL